MTGMIATAAPIDGPTHVVHLFAYRPERVPRDPDLAERQARRLADLIRVRGVAMGKTPRAIGARRVEVEIITPGGPAPEFDARDVMEAMIDGMVTNSLLLGISHQLAERGGVTARRGERHEAGTRLILTDLE